MSNNLLSTLFLVAFVLLSSKETESRTTTTQSPRFSSPEELSPSCGYQSCPKPVDGKLNIHLVPHTHDDVGWLKTVDQYYWGSRSSIAKAGVQYILDTVIEELLHDPKRRFIYVETAFLWKWWLNQNEEVRSDVRRLINEGRLEIISGGWSMNDEAVTHYQSIIDQFTWGLRRLNDTFGSCARPKIGWQIDPFGHSREQASIFAQMGFDGLFFGRLDYQDKTKRMGDKTAEMIWKASPSLGDKANLFTGVLFNTYSPPPGFCFDVLCDDEPIIDDPKSPDYNVDARVESFVTYAKKQSEYYRTNDVILTLGGDFTYQDSEMWYKNLDKLIRHSNERNGSTVNVFYSTPSCYLKALNDLNISWPTKSDDFFPYGSDPHTYWTGYFSSRPAIKFYERMGNNLLQISKQLSAIGEVENAENYLEPFREAMGVLQHHDAITGTEKQRVAQDYARILSEAIDGGESIIFSALEKIVQNKQRRRNSPNDIQFHSCHQLNVSACPHTEVTGNFVVTLYNPQSRKVSTYVRLPVTGSSYDVKDLTGTSLVTQIVPIPDGVKSIPGRESSAVNELVFRAQDIPALGFSSYYVSHTSNEPEIVGTADLQWVENEFFKATVNEDGSISTRRTVRSTSAPDGDIVQAFHYYESSSGNNEEFANRSSGAYILRPKDSTPTNLNLSDPLRVSTYNGPLVQEKHVKLNEWVAQVVRLYKEEEYVEYDWVVGPIPVEDGIGKEVITRYSSKLNSNKIFYTDSNGREMLKRERNYRPTWQLHLDEPVAGNYYPITAKISIKDTVSKTKRLSVLNDRAQGGSSLNDGEIELMLHRRILHDDAFGVGEALNEIAYGEGLVVRGRHHLVGGSSSRQSSIALKEKEIAWNLLNPPCVLISPAGGRTIDEWRNDFKMEGSGLAKELPKNIRLLTLEPWKDGSLLLRLEHMFEVGEDERFSHPAEVDIKNLFAPFVVTSARETKLAGNVWINDSERLNWRTESNEVIRGSRNLNLEQEFSEFSEQSEAINVLLNPMEIRTFVITVAPPPATTTTAA